jgi:predicted phosphate transport protein (TIGR00153 family)
MAKKFDYFATLENQADFAVQEAELLLHIMKNFDPHKMPEWLAQMHDLENAADAQIHEVYKHLATEFITPIDREDILLMAQKLDDIVDSIEDVLIQMHMFNVLELHKSALSFAELVLASAQALKRALAEFQTFKKANSQIKDHIVEVNDIEEEADHLYATAMHELYRDNTSNPLYIMIWGNLFGQLELSVDSCEIVADNLDTIILKNS